MANYHETTFGDFEVDERFKRLQRSLKLAKLKQKHNKDTHDVKASSMTAYPSWPSISSINVDTMDNSCRAPSLQTSLIKSEVIASSNNLRNMLLRKKSHNTNQKAMVTSSVKQYHIQQDRLNNDQHIMPPPVKSKVYRVSKDLQGKIYTSSNCGETEKTPSLTNSVQSFKADTFSLKTTPSWISVNTNSDKIRLNNLDAPPTPTDMNKVDQVFSKWKVKLNDQYELIIKGTLACGRLARSKPVIRRYDATCVESKYKHKYILQGSITDERNALPDYIRGKFYNGFPDDWENVYQIWRTYVSQGCPVTFRWPTRITDSDDDLKTEFTDLTYTCARNKKITSATRSCNLNEYPKTKNLMYKSDSEKKETSHNYFTHDSQNYEKNTSFVKSFIPNSEKNIISTVQTKHVKQLCDNENKQQNVKADVNLPCSSKKVKNNLKDILQEDKLNIIINNLADKNCSPKYIEKIIEMFDCLDYVVSYRTESECNNDSIVSMNHETSKSETTPVQQNMICDASHANINKLENNLTEPKSEIRRNNVDVYGHSTDLGYGSLRNDSHANQLSNPVNVNKPTENDKKSDLSESETYAGVPKISIERVLKARDLSRRIHRRKVKKKTADTQKCTMNLSHSAEEAKSKSVHVANPIAKNLPSIESCVSITEDEEEITNTRRQCHQITEITRRQQDMTFSSHRETHGSNFDLYREDKSVTQNKQPFDTFDNPTVNLNVFIKEQKVPHRIQEDTHLPFVADVDYTATSDIDVVTVSTNTERTDGSTTASHAKMDQEIVINRESNSNLPENPSLPLHREFTEQMKSETAVKKSKPTIISSMPVNLNLRISKAGSNTVQPQIIVRKEEKQDANIRSLEKTDRKTSVSKTSIATKSTANNSHSKTTVDNKREICPITNSKNELKTSTATKPTINDSHSKTTVNDKRNICPISESDNIKPTNPMMNPMIEQPNSSKLGTEENPKVLTAWMPKVVHYAKSKSELGLIFQGKLLNEAGHVVNRKFSTNVVLKRLSATLIETVNHEFYKLLGHLNDNKHNIPKELVKQCRYGCPAKIEQFCLSWKTQSEIKEKLHDATMDTLNAPVSSRGRHIIPPLCYWTGERITLKDNNLVYSPGNSQESSLLSLTDNSKEIKKNVNTEEEKKQKMNSKSPKKQSVNKQTLSESNKTSNTNKNQTIVIKKSRDYKTSPKVKDSTKNAKKFDNAKSRKSISNKRRLVKKLKFSTTESSEEEEKTSPRKRVRNAQTNENADAETRYTMTLRKRQKIETPLKRILRGDTAKSRPHTICSPNIHQAYYSPTKKSKNQQITYTYYTDIVQEDFLSEDEVSCV